MLLPRHKTKTISERLNLFRPDVSLVTQGKLLLELVKYFWSEVCRSGHTCYNAKIIFLMQKITDQSTQKNQKHTSCQQVH